ncbi:hypothetical protein V494_08633 [Pseudogymnoascus sp. VKM F-4513 (FW-928)]|nr:hypothetical protein V494_08633 [Pseudogymnoascus sp. VKM F-4513 (FW-928)]
MLLLGLYVVLKTKIKMAREVAWGAWGAEVERRILEFESLHGTARANEIEAFMAWVRGGEVHDGSPVVQQEQDEESAIGPALTDEEYQASWGSETQDDRGNGIDDANEDSWNMHGTVLRDLHMAVHWRHNADEQERAHREAQEVARLRTHVANSVAAEAVSHPETMAQRNDSAVELLDIDVDGDESAYSTWNDDSESKICEEDNLDKEQDDKEVTMGMTI